MTRAAQASSGDRVHAALMLLAALGTAAYWTAWFTTGAVQTADDAAYVAFENAFPLADGYMAVCWVVAAVLLLRARATAVPVGIAAGSAMVFLGLMDTLFNLEHRKYAAMTPEMAVETAINVGCLTFGPATMVRLWRARGRLDLGA
jgi:UDP-N-acetylmuramyl pentapeptide phosphotransferase/UDP-N-acetylglucosamine-1-phosphate transferase